MTLGALGHLSIGAEYPRPVLHPPYPDLSYAFLAWVQHIDPPGNVFPSLHVAHTTMLALILRAIAGGWARRAGDGDAAGAVDADHQAALHRRRARGLRAGVRWRGSRSQLRPLPAASWPARLLKPATTGADCSRGPCRGAACARRGR